MADHTKIEWTEATWNPVRGCSIVSPGCTNCYAMRQAHRHANAGGAYEGLTKMSKGGPVWTGEVRTVPELIDWPLRKKKPLRIFVNSMSDLFHEDVPEHFINDIFSVMAMAPQHVFQILTKRPHRMLDYVGAGGRGADVLDLARNTELAYWAGRDNAPPMTWPLSNVWLGVSVEDQKRADERIPLLLQTPAAVRWISAEPLLEPVTLSNYGTGASIAWVVVGGESGAGARLFDIAWARSLRDQCKAAGVPYFLKQIGRYPFSAKDEGYGWAQLYDKDQNALSEWGLFDPASSKGGDMAEWPEDLRVREYPA